MRARRKQGISEESCEILLELQLKLKLNPSASSEERILWYLRIKDLIPERERRIALALLECQYNIVQICNIFNGDATVPMNVNPGGTNATQIATTMTGVNGTGTQTMRDITIFSQDLDQSGSTISTEIRSALVEAREAIGGSDISPEMKSMIIEQFDKLADELKKGDKKSPGTLKGLWNMVYGAIQMAPHANSIMQSLDKLRCFIGL